MSTSSPEILMLGGQTMDSVAIMGPVKKDEGKKELNSNACIPANVTEDASKTMAIQALNPADSGLKPSSESFELRANGFSGHCIGTCKPCAFASKGLCKNGTQCSFCHFCGPDEKKRRKKALKAQVGVFQENNVPFSIFQPNMLVPTMSRPSEDAINCSFRSMVPQYITVPSWVQTLQRRMDRDNTTAKLHHLENVATPRFVSIASFTRQTAASNTLLNLVEPDREPENGEPCHSACSTADTEEFDDAHRKHGLGSVELPTIGSYKHQFGVCKPCAFAFKGKCESGTSCKFCHICGPDEIKNRKKALKQKRLSIQLGVNPWWLQ